jgi:hypothetical protein
MDPSLIHHDPLDVQMSDFSGLAAFGGYISPNAPRLFESSVIS